MDTRKRILAWGVAGVSLAACGFVVLGLGLELVRLRWAVLVFGTGAYLASASFKALRKVPEEA